VVRVWITGVGYAAAGCDRNAARQTAGPGPNKPKAWCSVMLCLDRHRIDGVEEMAGYGNVV